MKIKKFNESMKYLKYLKESIISDKIEKLEDLILDLKDEGLIVDIIRDNPPTFTLRCDGYYITSINNSNSSFFGGKNQLYRHSAKSKIGFSAVSNKVIEWFFQHYFKNPNDYKTIKVYHSGKCGKCGKKLTTPESIKSGLGPYCGKRN